ncbi:reverse transcriptase [Tanacetum coccineum]
MRVRGHVLKQILHILMDSGSTHNFLDLYMAKRLGCKIRNTCPLEVSVARGSKLISQYMVKSFQWKLQGVVFETDVMLLPLGGCEIVLGVQWLSTLGTIQWNFKDLVMKFLYEGQKVHGKAQLSALCCVGQEVTLNLMQCNSGQEMVLGAELTHMLEEYADVVEVPKELPPQRQFDHKIPLKEYNVTINIKPYRYPHSQKDTIETMVRELLDSGVIRPSNSPFLSPIVMVKKKDKSWRMCIDYRQLNKHTVKDKFPILVIEELIDELQGAQEWPVPTTLKHLRGFLGLTGYYTRFIKGYATISQPLTMLLKKNAFQWNSQAQEAFKRLQQAMWRGYPLDRHFKIRTDHFSLKYVLDQRLTTPFQSKWLPKLLGYDYEIEYKKGVDNAVADVLYIIERQGVLFSLLAGTSNEIMDDVVATWSSDSSLQAIIKGLQDKTLIDSKYSWQNDQLRRKDKWVVGKDFELRKKLFEDNGQGMGKECFVSDGGQKAQDIRIKSQADRNFELSDWVYLKLQPYRQLTVRQGRHYKLSSKFFGPFQVLAKIGKVAYKLKLPETARVHLVFHVSQLKPHYSDSASKCSFPLCDSEGHLAATPLKLLDRRMVKQNNQIVVFGLIQWSNGSEEDATWERFDDLLTRFPEFILDP